MDKPKFSPLDLLLIPLMSISSINKRFYLQKRDL